jgi:tetratricopeptide (TPR) repeat protein
MTENVRLQNLREFTVQIRDANDRIIGTGIAVSLDGKIVTCRHVIEAAGINPRGANGAEVGIYFPQLRGGEEKSRKAIVEQFFPEHDDDVVLLQLTGGPSPLAPEQMPVLGTAAFSAGHAFKSFGYRRLSNYLGLPASGEIVDYSDKPQGLELLVEPLMLASQHIDSGMSGAGVLDMERNLIVGIISETYESAARQKDRDTAFAVDNHVLTFIPFDFVLEQEPYPLRPAPSPKIDIVAGQTTLVTIEKYVWNSAPAILDEWTGRDELLKQLTDDWNDPKKHVTGLIGFGGEGKSSLARKWLGNLLNDPSQSQPDGIFWWGFYENRSVDEFFEATLKYFGVDARRYQSSSQRAQIIGVLLATGCYLFVLDGLEVAQHQDGDRYGLLQNNDLRDLLTFFARPDHSSFCLVTSRAPLLDLMDYITYSHRDLERLLPADGRALLERVGVQGTRVQLDKVVSDWDGHALTLSLLGSYLSAHYGGDIAHLTDIPAPIADEPKYERIHRVLRRYDEHLTETEREFLKLFSAFRTPVHEGAFEKVFAPLLNLSNPDIVPVGYSEIPDLINHLVTYRILRHDAASQTYTAHPLVRNHYLAIFTKDTEAPNTHLKIKDYYLSIAGDTPKYPTLDDLKPLIEVVHHACQAGAYDEAFEVFYRNIQRGDGQNALNYHIGAYETELALMFEFLPNGGSTKEPQTSKSDYSRFIFNEIGFCLMNLGRLREAMPFFGRYVKDSIEAQDWMNANVGCRNLAELHASLGALKVSAEATRQALEFTRRADDKFERSAPLFYQGWVAHLRGELQSAKDIFSEAEQAEIERHKKQVGYLYSNRGIFHADHLHRTGQSDYARRVSEANLPICEKLHAIKDISMCHRVLGDLDFSSDNHTSAHAHYEAALKIARGISVRDALIEALLARGRWVAKEFRSLKDFGILVDQAFNDLNEALGYCVESSYRIYEADVRVALGWAYLANDEAQKAKESAERALQMSEEMGYYWGKLDANEVLAKVV